MKKIILRFIRFYQKTSFFHHQLFQALFLSDKACRFRPTCSKYTYKAVKKHGAVSGLFQGLKRIVRCHPWSSGGYHPVK